MACILAQKIIRAASHRDPGAYYVTGNRIMALERAMAAHRGSTLSFAATEDEPFDNWLFPPSPFSAILMEAYAPHFSRDPYWTKPLWETFGPDQRPLAEHWISAVIDPFVECYQLVISDNFRSRSQGLRR